MADEDGGILIGVNLDINEAEQELSRLKKKILRLQEDLYVKKSRKTNIEESLANARAELSAIQSQTKIGDNNRAIITPENVEKISELGEKIKAMEADLEASNAEIEKTTQNLQAESDWYGEVAKKAQEIRSTDEEVANATEAVANAAGNAEEALEGMGDAGEESVKQTSEAMIQMTEHLKRFEKRIIGLTKRVFVFSLITSALRNMRTWLANAVKSNDQAAAAIARLKGALLTMAQPILQIVIPAFIMLINILTRVVNAIAKVTSALFGTTIKQSAEAAKNLNDEQKALKGVGASAKKAGKNLASFDEINKLSDSDGGAGGAGAGGAIAPDFSGILEGRLSEIEAIVSGAMLAIGAILTFTGANIPLGIALMAAGAVGLVAYARENWDAIAEMLRGPIGAVVTMVSGALLMLGAVMAFTGANIPLGIALMAAGSVGLIAAASANWDELKKELQGPIGTVTALISGALLALGAVLAFSGYNIPLGIALMAAGAIGLAAVSAANWDSIKKAIQGPVGAITALISGALLVLGALLTFSGANIPLGLGLMVAGAIGLAATVAANWNTIKDTLGGTIQTIVAIVSGALLVLGAVLLFTGANIPLGLGLLIAGGAGLAATVAPRWGAILEKLKSTWADIKQWWNTSVSQYFTAEYWKDLGAKMLEGLFQGLSNIKSKITTWGSDVITNVKNVFGIHSPSKEFEEIGAYSVAGLEKGFAQMPAVTKQFQTMLAGMKTSADDLAKDTLALIEAVYKMLETVLANAAQNTRATMSQMTAEYQSMARQSVSAIQSIIAQLNAIPRNITTVHTIITQNVSSGGSSTSKTTSVKASVPKLATGAVIPPNREFLAVLGDQKSGTNIEAPYDMIVQAVRQGNAESGGGSRPITLVLELDRRQFGKATFDAYNMESQRIGVQLGGV